MAERKKRYGVEPSFVDNTSDLSKPRSLAEIAADAELQTQIDTKVDGTAVISAATHTKVSYNNKGLITSGSDATTADIADSVDARYVTDAELAVLAVTSGVNSGDQTDATLPFTDNTTNNVSTAKHGYVPKATNIGNYLKDDGTWASIPAGYTDEQAQDAVGTIVDTSLVYVDGTPLLTRAALTGDVTASQGSNSTTIATAAVTLAKMADMATASVIYRKSSGTGIPEVNTLATLKTDLGLAGTNSGDQTLSSLGLSTAANLNMKTISCSFDGKGGVCSTGTGGNHITVPFSGTIVGWNITAVGLSPTCTIDVWKIATGTALPTVSNTIMGTKPALATGNAIHSTTLTGWSTSVAANDIIIFNLDAVTVATSVTITLQITVS